MIDLLLEKKYHIKQKYWYDEDTIICEVRGEYLGQQYKFQKALSHYQIISAKFDIIEITMEDLKNTLIKFIGEKAITT